MGGLFGGGSPVVSAITPTGLPKLRPQRMPTENDPAVLAAAQRTRENALRRRGRLSTIMTDDNNSMIGSSGKTLGE